MFIIYGSPRSGTTLLSTTLNLSDHIIIPDETDFIVPTAYIFNRVKDPEIGKMLIGELISSTNRFDFSIGKYLSKSDVVSAVKNADYALSSIISSVYNKISEKLGRTIAGDKSPNDLSHFGSLYKNGLFNGKIKVIHIVRDIRDVVLSLKRVEWSSPEVESNFPQSWNNSNVKLFNLFNRKKEYLLVKYEALVTNPAAVFGQICGFLGVPFQDKMLDYEKRGKELREQKHHSNLGLPFLSEKAGNWEKTMPPELVKQCEKDAYNALVLFGYKLTSKPFSPIKLTSSKQSIMEIKIRKRDEKIIGLQNKVGELTAWARKLDKTVKQKDARIIDLQNEVEELGSWGRRLDEEIKQKDSDISLLKKKLKPE